MGNKEEQVSGMSEKKKRGKKEWKVREKGKGECKQNKQKIEIGKERK